MVQPNSIVSTNPITGQVEIVLVNQQGIFDSGTLPSVPAGSQILTNFDANGDQKDALLVRNQTTGATEVRLIADTGQSTVNPFTSQQPLGPEWQVASTADFNADGKEDILWRNPNGSNQIWLSGGTSILSEGTLPALGAEWQLQSDGDFNGNGRGDLFFRNTVTGENRIWMMEETSIVASGLAPTADVNWNVIGQGDFNGNGSADLLWENPATSKIGIWSMNGVQPQLGYSAFDKKDPSWEYQGVGDFNGDSTDDIFWINSATSQAAVWVMGGVDPVTGGAQPLSYALLNVPVTPGSQVEAVKDYTGDRNSDVFFLNGVTGERTVWAFEPSPFDPNGVTYSPIALTPQTPGFEVVDPTIV